MLPCWWNFSALGNRCRGWYSRRLNSGPTKHIRISFHKPANYRYPRCRWEEKIAYLNWSGEKNWCSKDQLGTLSAGTQHNVHRYSKTTTPTAVPHACAICKATKKKTPNKSATGGRRLLESFWGHMRRCMKMIGFHGRGSSPPPRSEGGADLSSLSTPLPSIYQQLIHLFCTWKRSPKSTPGASVLKITEDKCLLEEGCCPAWHFWRLWSVDVYLH